MWSLQFSAEIPFILVDITGHDKLAEFNVIKTAHRPSRLTLLL
jgi:hypothetical protein